MLDREAMSSAIPPTDAVTKQWVTDALRKEPGKQNLMPVRLEMELIRKQIHDLAALYDHLRACIPEGKARTGMMSIVASNLQMLAPAAESVVPNLARSTSPGRRLAAICILQARPRRDYLSWLAHRLDTETPFVGYESCRAIAAAATELSGNDVDAIEEVSAAVADARARLGSGPDTEGRARVLDEADALLRPKP